MRILSWIIIVVQIAAILFILYIQYGFRHLSGEYTDRWLSIGEHVMNSQGIVIGFFIASGLVTVFLKEKLWVKIVVVLSTIIGLVIVGNLYLWPY